MDVQAPKGSGEELDEFINDIVLPKLQKFGTVGLNMGKRLNGGSSILAAALSRYNNECQVELNLSPDNCYTPICERNNAVTSFEYPSEYYG